MSNAIGILGGTFDPVHAGHLRLAIEARQRLQLNEVRLIPLHIPPHRPAPVASNEQRLQMLFSATGNIDGLSIDEREIKRNDTSWTIDTLKSIRDQYADNPVCLLLGSDAFAGFDQWKNWQDITDYAHIVIVNRAFETNNHGSGLKDWLSLRLTHNNNDLISSRCGHVFQLELPLLDVSSSYIRAQIAAGRDIDFLVPESVQKIIHEQKLYL